MRILIVDDDYISRTKLKAMLSCYGDCDAVPSGKMAIEIIEHAHNEKLPYELITMDINMPGERGQDVVKAIRDLEERRGIPRKGIESKILMITVTDDAKEIVTSFRKGCEWYLVKPVTPEALRKAMQMIGFAI